MIDYKQFIVTKKNYYLYCYYSKLIKTIMKYYLHLVFYGTYRVIWN